MKYLFTLILLILIPKIASALDNKVNIKHQTDINLVPVAMGIMGTSIIVAHIFAPDTYSWSRNTMSELAAQNYGNAWIMRTGLIGFGTLISTAATWDLISERKHWSQTIPLIIYGDGCAAKRCQVIAGLDGAQSSRTEWHHQGCPGV